MDPLNTNLVNLVTNINIDEVKKGGEKIKISRLIECINNCASIVSSNNLLIKNKLTEIKDTLDKNGQQEFAKTIDKFCKKVFTEGVKEGNTDHAGLKPVPLAPPSPVQKASEFPTAQQVPALSLQERPCEEDEKAQAVSAPCVMHLSPTQRSYQNPYVTGDYASLTTQLLRDQHKLIEEVCEKERAEVDAFCAKVQTGSLGDSTSDVGCRYPLWALAAVKLEKLSLDDFCVIMTHWCISKHHKQVQVMDFTNLEGMQHTKQLLLHTMLLSDKPSPNLAEQINDFLAGHTMDEEFYKTYPHCLTQNQFNEFFKKLQELSPFQRKYWLIIAKDDPSDNSSHVDTNPLSSLGALNEEDFDKLASEPKISIVTAMTKLYKMSIFYNMMSSNPDAERTCKIIPNLSMVGAYLHIKRTELIKFEPMIGQIAPYQLRKYTPCRESLQSKLKDTCFVSLAFPFLMYQSFKKIHEFAIHHDYDLTYYDSMIRGNALLDISLPVRKLRIKIVQKLDTLATTDETHRDPLDAMRILYKVLIEMQSTPRAKNSLNNVFLLCRNELVLGRLSGKAKESIERLISVSERIFQALITGRFYQTMRYCIPSEEGVEDFERFVTQQITFGTDHWR